MAFPYKLEILVLAVITGFCIIFGYTSLVSPGAEFNGTDDVAAARITDAANGTVQPLIPQWVSGSTELESTLFALQAAAGGFIIGIVFGYWIGRKKQQTGTS